MAPIALSCNTVSPLATLRAQRPAAVAASSRCRAAAPSALLRQGQCRGAKFCAAPAIKRVRSATATNQATASDAIVMVNSEEEMKTLLAKGGVVVADFYAEWCGPCKLVAPQFDKLAAAPTLAGITFCKVDVGKLPKEYVGELGVKALPTFTAFRDGAITGSYVGSKPSDLVKFVDGLKV